MVGLFFTLKDGTRVYVPEIRILETYDGMLAGTLTTGTRHRLPDIRKRMDDLKAGRETGYFYPEPELVDEAALKGLSPEEVEAEKRYEAYGKCLKEQHLVATLHFHADTDDCHILEFHWFQTAEELAATPILTLLSEALNPFSFADLYPYCEHVDWLDMY